jgi:tetratricopeptide (TPR) repeat protein
MIIVGSMTARLTAPLRAAPATVPALAAIVLFVVWATSQAGYPVTHWAPGALIVMALLAIALIATPLRFAEVPPAVWIALGALAAFTLLSYLSILWAPDTGEAWEGANRTLLYLLVFALFALWRAHGASAALVLCVWTLALIVLASFTVLHLDAASGASLPTLIPGGRLDYPSGYPNANAAQWLMAFWPALLLAGSARLPWGVRGALAGGAVLLAEVALLSQSRGSLYATPVVLVLVFALLPGRTRTFALLVPVAAGIGAAAPAVLRADDLKDGVVTHAAVHTATVAMLAAAIAVGLVVAILAATEDRLQLSQAARGRVRTGVRIAALAALVAVIAGGLLAFGSPVGRIERGWATFKGGYAADSTTGNRLIGGLGSNRYDFYRVALDEFLHHPLVGIGADNFEQQYLLHGRSNETPHYPHSVELRTLTDTGRVGSLLLLSCLAAALVAAARALRSRDPLVTAAAAAALAGFAYWIVHGSFDWFWEFAGLGAPAFALLGIACALAPPRAAPSAAAEPDGINRHRHRHRPRLALAGAAALALAGVVSLGAPWLSRLELESAAKVWTTAPQTAYARLRSAADLNPLSDEAFLLAGSIALRYGELPRAAHQFSLALGRNRNDAYATLELGAIDAVRDNHASALVLLERAVQLSPREPINRQVLAAVRARRPVSIEELNGAILLKAQQIE